MMPVILRSFNQQNLGRLGNVEAGFKLGKHVFKPKTRTVDVEHTLGDEKKPKFWSPWSSCGLSDDGIRGLFQPLNSLGKWRVTLW